MDKDLEEMLKNVITQQNDTLLTMSKIIKLHSKQISALENEVEKLKGGK